MIEAYYQEGKNISDIAIALKGARQTIINVITFLNPYDHYERYKANKKRCRQKETQLIILHSRAFGTGLEPFMALKELSLRPFLSGIAFKNYYQTEHR